MRESRRDTQQQERFVVHAEDALDPNVNLKMNFLDDSEAYNYDSYAQSSKQMKKYQRRIAKSKNMEEVDFDDQPKKLRKIPPPQDRI